MLLYKDHPQMIKGDSYSGGAKYQILFSFVFILSLLSSALTFLLMPIHFFYFFFFSLIALVILFFVNLKLFFNLIKRTNFIEAIATCFLQVARSIAWLFGAIKGVWKYQITRIFYRKLDKCMDYIKTKVLLNYKMRNNRRHNIG